ncbi:MAG: Ig-like domain-containing protein [Gemmatimonadaceae bacterium]|nr:Ig-like domain-containing protein [Gemmatimonadaceae bacterium]
MKRLVSKTRAQLVAAVGLFALVACSDGSPSATIVVPPDTTRVVKVIAVAVSLDSSVVQAGSSVQALATPLDANGVPLPARAVTWSLDGNLSLATISSTGLITTLLPGISVIVATVDGIRGDGVLIIRPRVSVAAVQVSLDSTTLLVGRTSTARALVSDAVGEPVVGRPITWSMRGSPTVASVNSLGTVTALAPGGVAIIASVDGISGEDSLTVVAPSVAPVTRVEVTLDAPTVPTGRTTQARFRAYDAAGSTLPGKSVSWSILPTSASATISNLGVVTAVAVGSAQVTGVVDGVVGSALLTVVDTSTAGNQVRLPDLPADSVVLRYPVDIRNSVLVKAGDNLQGALNAAQRGDEIVLQAGATFTGTFTLPAKPGNSSAGWVLVRSEQQAALPARGVRVTPAVASLMPKIVTPTSAAALQTAAGASGWWVTGVEITIVPTFTSNNFGLVLLGDGSSKQNQAALIPSDIVLDRVYIHSQPNVGTSRCVALNSARTAIVDSYLDECHLKGFDSQAIVGWNGPGPFRIENHTLMGAGENVMFGGSDPFIAGLIPSDIIVRRNFIYTPASWKQKWTKKNLFELKNAQRVLIEENVLDGSWGDAQVGFAILFKSANQSGRCNWCASRDVTVRGNLIRNAAGGFNLTGREGANPHPVGELLTRVLIEQNWLEEIDTPEFSGDGKFLQILQNLSHLTVRYNTMVTTSSTFSHFIGVGNLPAATAMSFTNNIVSRGRYGLFSTSGGEGAKALNNVRAPVEFRDVVVISAERPGYPPGTTFVPTLAAAIAIPNVGANEVRIRAMAQAVIVP